eukprot:TRINITY_DN174_c0_g2_i2.p1 TRINITY_DN174_c0_g2~~TRINITY_DN174_c0_g2_i2.p1  ORF type:complete len:418 (-),score=108.71 TRINITY_DN174_c0_g2_i2:385-1638(-)
MQERAVLERELMLLREKQEEEKSSWLKEKEKVNMIKVDFPSIVRVNVRGTFFTTSKEALMSEPGSSLAALVSGKHELGTSRSSPGEHDIGGADLFINRDPKVFECILNWLEYCRSGQQRQFKEYFDYLDKKELLLLKLDAEFFQLKQLCEALGVEIASASTHGNDNDTNEDKKEEVVSDKRKSNRKLRKIDKELFSKIYFASRVAAVKHLAFKFLDFSYIDLRSLDLRFAQFVGCNLSSCSLSFSDLSEARFEDCELIGVDFCQAILSGVNFKNCILKNCQDFFTCAVKSVNFEGMDLSGLGSFSEWKDVALWFERCDLTGVFEDFPVTTWSFKDCKDDSMSLTNAEMRGPPYLERTYFMTNPYKYLLYLKHHLKPGMNGKRGRNYSFSGWDGDTCIWKDYNSNNRQYSFWCGNDYL